MIYINGIKIEHETFGDGTLKCNIESKEDAIETSLYGDKNEFVISWFYENDGELFLLYSLTQFLREKYSRPYIELIMPYIPNARQDRFVSGRLFTLKYFTNIINSMNFDCVSVLDPHSDVSTALLNNVHTMNLFYYLYSNVMKGVKGAILFPDNGAAKKYREQVKEFSADSEFMKGRDVIIGNKHRNKEGRIDSYELIDFPEKAPETVFIIDDICSYGGTFLSASKALREKGVKNVYLIVSHCEENIFKGDALKELDGVFTTNSILSDAVIKEKDIDKKITISYRFI